MRTDDVVKFFGSKANAARALNLTRGAITNWGEIVPETSVWRVEKATKGKLRGDFEFYKKLSEKAS